MLRSASLLLVLGGAPVLLAACNDITGASGYYVRDSRKTDVDGTSKTDTASEGDSGRGSDGGPGNERDASLHDGAVEGGSGCKATPFMRGHAATGSWESLPGALAAADGQSATFSFTLKNVPSSQLKVSDLGFALPPTATINGVTARVTRSGSTRYIKDSTVTLVDGESEIGANQAATSLEWPTDLQLKTYGGELDLWGTTLTPAVANASSFGLIITCGVFTLGSVTSTPVAAVDEVSISISYCE